MNAPSRAGEVARKVDQVQRLLAEYDVDALLFERRGPVGWLLAGADTHVRQDSEAGVAVVAVERSGRITVFTNKIEVTRLLDEELAGLPVQAEACGWQDKTTEFALDVLIKRGRAKNKILAEASLPTQMAERLRELRYEFGPDELARYRRLCHDCAVDLEAVAGNLQAEMTEHEVAADLVLHVTQRGYRPTVVLVAFDDRIHRYRHPVPTHRKLERRAMVVFCAEAGGQVMAATRFAGLVPLTTDLQERFAAVIDVEASGLATCRPGVRAADVFATMLATYAKHGFADEWQLHHQGGAIGYAGREYKGTRSASQIVRVNQPFAWNPSITGTKCEDTVLITEQGWEILTATGNWATVQTPVGARPTELLLHANT